MDLYLVRHGQDRAAVGQRFGDEGLSDTGLAQARALAESLGPIPFARCLCSPLRRALETAEKLCAAREIEPEIEPDLAEGSLGALDGLSQEEAEARFPDYFRLGHSIGARLAATGRTAPDGPGLAGETLEAFLERARRVLARLERERAQTSRLLVVAHGGLLNLVLQLLLGLEARERVPFGFEHCGVLRVLDYREPPGYGPFPMLRFGPYA